jgi:hypothetical protein
MFSLSNLSSPLESVFFCSARSVISGPLLSFLWLAAVFRSSRYSRVCRNRIIIIGLDHQTVAAADSEILVFILCSAGLKFCASASCFSRSHFAGNQHAKFAWKLSPNVTVFQVLPLTMLCAESISGFSLCELCAPRAPVLLKTRGVSWQRKPFPSSILAFLVSWELDVVVYLSFVLSLQERRWQRRCRERLP